MDEARFATLLARGKESGLRFDLMDAGITWEIRPGIDPPRLNYG